MASVCVCDCLVVHLMCVIACVWLFACVCVCLCVWMVACLYVLCGCVYV